MEGWEADQSEKRLGRVSSSIQEREVDKSRPPFEVHLFSTPLALIFSCFLSSQYS